MADLKISALTALGTLSTDDLFAVVDDPGGTPLSRKATGTQVQTLTRTFADNTGLVDDSANELLWFQKTASAVTYLEITNGATTDYPQISPAGETNVGIKFDVAGDPTAGTRFYSYEFDMGPGDATEFYVYSTGDGNNGPGITLYYDSVTPAANDKIGFLRFQGNDDAAAQRNFCRWEIVATDVGAATYSGDFRVFTPALAVVSETMRITGSSGNINIGSAADGARRLHVNETNATTNAVTYVERLQVQSSGTPANNIGVGQEFVVETAANNHEVGVVIRAVCTDVTAAAENFELQFATMAAGTLSPTCFNINNLGKVSVTGTNSGYLFGDRDGVSGVSFLYRDTNISYFWDSTNRLAFYHATGNLSVGAVSTADRRLHVEEENATTNAVTYLERLSIYSSGTPANNIGVGIEFEVEAQAGDNKVGATIEAVGTDVTNDSEDFTVRVKTMTAGQAAATSLNISLPGTVYPQGQIFGLTMSNAADTSNDITIAAGEAVDETGVWNMTLAAATTKQIDAVWAVGTGAGGINIISVANDTWYEVILIGREDTRVVDVMFSTTANRATLPTSYTHKRRIGWVRRLTGTLALFTQIDDYVTLTTQINDSSTAITATAAAITLTVPPSSIARFRATLQMTALALAAEAITVFSEIVEGNVTPAGSTGIASLGAGGQNATSASNDWTSAGHFELRVSSTSTIEHDSALGSGAAGTFDISTFGWIDHRRRLSAT